jgi:hypothetical protein
VRSDAPRAIDPAGEEVLGPRTELDRGIGALGFEVAIDHLADEPIAVERDRAADTDPVDEQPPRCWNE